MNNEIKEILENIKCPQLGYDEYGKWGALPLNVRMTLKRLCDYVVSCDDYITNLQQENERLKEEYKNKLDKTLEVLQYELQFQTGGCYHRLSNLFDYLQNGSDDNE